MAHTFSSVTLEAEHVTETHRTLENDHTVTETELPGTVNLYAVFDGGRVLIDQFKAPVVLEAIDKAKQSQSSQDAAQTQPQTAQGGEQTQTGGQTSGEQTQPQS